MNSFFELDIYLLLTNNPIDIDFKDGFEHKLGDFYEKRIIFEHKLNFLY